jgi:hypothetical protein
MKKNKLIFIVFSFLWSALSLAQNNCDTLKVLFVGNSYTYFSNMPHLVSLISDSVHTKLITSKSTIGGATLSEHWNGERGLKTKDLIKTGDFDIVVLQEQSMGTINQPDSFLVYSKKLCNYIKENGAIPYFYMTWAREKVPQFQETITNVYAQAAIENDAGLVKVGEAWKFAQTIRPKVELHLNDGSHPSPLGAFLTACVFVQALTKEIPASLPRKYSILDANGESVILQTINPLDVEFCLQVTQEISK